MKIKENNISFFEHTDIEVVFGECIHSFPTHIHEILCVGQITEGCAEFIIVRVTNIFKTIAMNVFMDIMVES